MKKITLILGGARSGKSTLAVELAKKQCGRIAYIATAPVCDEEMRLRVHLHKKSRPKEWATIEVDRALYPRLKKIPKRCDGVIIECVATYVSNLVMADFSDSEILKDIKSSLARLKKLNKKIFIVSNEVGDGVVPDTELGRRFRDLAGTANQIIAKEAGEVYLVTAGLPLKLK